MVSVPNRAVLNCLIENELQNDVDFRFIPVQCSCPEKHIFDLVFFTQFSLRHSIFPFGFESYSCSVFLSGEKECVHKRRISFSLLNLRHCILLIKAIVIKIIE